jgi:hypothetical protein
MVIESTRHDPKVDEIFRPVAERVRARGAEVVRELKSSQSKNRA